MSKKLLIGGKALNDLGSPRTTEDVDYFIRDESKDLFFKENDIDYINAAGHPLYAALWELEADNIGPLASPQTLLISKAFAFVNHCKNGFWQKADDAEYDIKYLVRHCGVRDISLLEPHVDAGAFKEVQKLIDSVR